MLRLADNPQGFTLIEVLLVVAIITIITAITAPLFLGFQNTNELNVATNTLAQYLYEAQSYSRGEAHDCSWGVTISGQQLTLFCGGSYASRNPTYDNSYIIPGNIQIQQNQEVIYSKLDGLPQTTGSFDLVSGSQTSTVSVNAKGMVEY